jgi:hypothetical protein
MNWVFNRIVNTEKNQISPVVTTVFRKAQQESRGEQGTLL